MHRGIGQAAAGMAACALVLAACSAGPSRSLPPEPTDLTPFLSQDVAWSDCPASDDFLDDIPDEAQCATVQVPVDYFDGASGRGTLDLALIRVSASGPSQGSLLVNPGGPGASGFELVARSGKQLQRNLPGYDIVGFDPRGVARSAGFDCKQSTSARKALIEQDFTPEDPAEFEETYQRSDDYERACRDAYPAWGFLGTSSVARDVHVISRALGDPGINFYGISYGSAIGYEILRTFPDDVDRMILESPVDPSVDQVVAEQLKAFNAKIEELLVLCASPEYSYCGQGRTAAQVRDDFLAIAADIENPDLGTLTGDGTPSETLVYYGMLLPLYAEWNDEYAKLYIDALTALLNDGVASNFERWGYLYQGYDPTQRAFFQTDDIQQLVLCLDESKPLAETDIEQERSDDAAEIAAIERDAPLLYAVGFSDTYLGDDRAFGPCSYAQEAFADPTIPDPLPEAPDVTNPASAPVLVLGISGDTATPYQWSQTIAGKLGVPLVTQDTTGHGVYVESQNPCTRDVVATYLGSATLPSTDVTC